MPSLEQPITVIVRRVARAGRESEFEDTMQAFIVDSIGFPGSSDFHVVRPSSSESREYTVVHRFTSESARQAFVSSPEYREWMIRLREITEEDPRIQEFNGLAGWFTLPGDRTATTRHGPPTRARMALVTFVGVYPLTALLPGWFARTLPWAHPLVVNIFATGTIVALLTWAVMPLLTRVFRQWLFGAGHSTKESST